MRFFSAIYLAGATGIEPISTVLETAILTVVLRPYYVEMKPSKHSFSGTLKGARPSLCPSKEYLDGLIVA